MIKLKKLLLNEAKANLTKIASANLGKFRTSLKTFQRRTTDKKWKTQLGIVLKDIDKLEAKCKSITSKMGDITLEGKVIKLKDIMNEAVENETNLPFEIVGSNSILIKGRKLSVKLVFNGSDLKNVVDGKTKKGRVTLASVNIK